MKWEDLTRKLYGKTGKNRNFSGASKASYGPAFPPGQFPMSSVPGEPRNGEGGAMSSVPGGDAGAAAGAPAAAESNGASAAPITESEGKRRIRAMLESIIDQSPDADVISQISDLFKSFVSEKDKSNILRRTYPEPLPQETDDDAVSSAAAACEAALQTYRALTGHDYNK